MNLNLKFFVKLEVCKLNFPSFYKLEIIVIAEIGNIFGSYHFGQKHFFPPKYFSNYKASSGTLFLLLLSMILRDQPIAFSYRILFKYTLLIWLTLRKVYQMWTLNCSFLKTFVYIICIICSINFYRTYKFYKKIFFLL